MLGQIKCFIHDCAFDVLQYGFRLMKAKNVNFSNTETMPSSSKKNLKNQKGILTIDFIFSFMMVMGLFQLFYVISYTFMVAHLTQYITFASARMFFAGHIDVQSQAALAEKKFTDLTQNTSMSSFYRRAFKISNFEAREFTEIVAPYPERQKYVGVRVNFISNILDFNVPLLGRTNSELDGQAFSADFSAFLYREPTATECFRFIEDRAKAILDLNARFGQAEKFGFTTNTFGVFADNGC